MVTFLPRYLVIMVNSETLSYGGLTTDITYTTLDGQDSIVLFESHVVNGFQPEFKGHQRSLPGGLHFRFRPARLLDPVHAYHLPQSRRTQQPQPE